MKAPTISVLCWRHGTVLEIATAAASEGEFRITVHTCMDCKREGRLSGYNEARAELIPEVGSREWMEDQLPP